MQVAVRTQVFYGCDLPSGCGPHLDPARVRGHAVDQDGARAALAFATAVFGSGEIEIVAQHAEQRAVGIGVDTAAGSVDLEFGHRGHALTVACGRLAPLACQTVTRVPSNFVNVYPSKSSL